MGMAQVQGLLDVEVTLEAYIGQDQYGRPTLRDGRKIKARVEQGRMIVRGGDGQSLVGKYKVILGEPVLVDPRDRITLPKEFGVRDANGDFQTAQPPILEARPVFYRGVYDHTILILG
jgi:hypothetical protein